MRTKIVATIGPRSESPEMLRALAEAGMDIARMNFSHCTQPEFIQRSTTLRSIGTALHRDIKIMQDLKGPRLRVGNVSSEGRTFTLDEEVVFSTKKGAADALWIDDPYLHVDIQTEDPLFLANGAIEMVVTGVQNDRITARVIRGGRVFANVAVNVPRTHLTTAGLTEKDITDVQFALAHGVDYIALSFVQSAEDVNTLREIVKGRAKIIAKIERRVALTHIDDIIQAADGIMVARGDLGAELPVEEVPFVQKNLIRHAAWHGKPSIVATQMLFSMVDRPHPTRAEVSDVANAVWDGADAVMLSDETASGKFPVESVHTMARIIKRTEHFRYRMDTTL